MVVRRCVAPPTQEMRWAHVWPVWRNGYEGIVCVLALQKLCGYIVNCLWASGGQSTVDWKWESLSHTMMLVWLCVVWLLLSGARYIATCNQNNTALYHCFDEATSEMNNILIAVCAVKQNQCEYNINDCSKKLIVIIWLRQHCFYMCYSRSVAIMVILFSSMAYLTSEVCNYCNSFWVQSSSH